MAGTIFGNSNIWNLSTHTLLRLFVLLESCRSLSKSCETPSRRLQFSHLLSFLICKLRLVALTLLALRLLAVLVVQLLLVRVVRVVVGERFDAIAAAQATRRDTLESKQKTTE